MTRPTSPPRGRALLDVSRAELPFAGLMLAYFFLVTTTFWILKPLKKVLFIERYDRPGFDLVGWHLEAAEVELLAKVLNMLVAIAAVALFSWLAARLRRERLAMAFATLFGAGFAVYALLLVDPGALTVWSFYLFGDVFSSLMVATFFAFLNDSVSPAAARRLYGPIGVGGVVGGAVGSTLLGTWIDRLGASPWLGICCGLAVAIAATAWMAGRAARALPAGSRAPDATRSTGDDRSHSAVAAARLVARTPYLLAIVAMVGLYEVVSTILDFQFTSAVSHYLNGEAIGRHVARVFALTNGAALVIQLLLTAFVMTRFGVGTALLVLPASILLASGGFLLAPTLVLGSLLSIGDNAFNYSINQSAREALYVPTAPEEKYQAKAVIDVFVQRFAKTIGIVVSLGMGHWFGAYDSVRWLSLAACAVVVLWVAAARYAGRAFAERTR